MRKLSAFLGLAALGCALAAGSAHGDPRCTEPAGVTELGVQRSDDAPIQEPTLFATQHWRPRAEDRTARYVRLQIERADTAATGWRLAVRSKALRLLQVFGPEDFGDQNIWTRRLPFPQGEGDPQIRLELALGRDRSDPGLKIVGYLAMPRDAERPLYSRTAGSREVDLFEGGADPDGLWRIRGDAVGLFLANWNKSSWCCSGVFLTGDLLLTNWHCGGVPLTLPDGISPSLYWNPRLCESILIDGSWDADAVSREYVPTSCAAGARASRTVEAFDRDLDYALLRVRQLPDSGPQRSAAIRFDAVAGPESLVILHHAGCKPKRLSDTCSVREVDHVSWQDHTPKVDFTHSCDTELGSSGAPVFDDVGRLVGLHHLGFAWEDNCVDSDKRNKAVKILRILADLPRTLCLEIVGAAPDGVCAASGGS